MKKGEGDFEASLHLGTGYNAILSIIMQSYIHIRLLRHE